MTQARVFSVQVHSCSSKNSLEVEIEKYMQNNKYG